MEFNDLKGMFDEMKTRMDHAIERVRKDMANVRTGRATVGLLDNIHVEAYGSKMPLNQLASLSVPEPSMIVAQPFDASLMKAIERAIQTSDLGLNPANDGKIIRLPIPPLTEERRKELVKKLHGVAEHHRVAVRNIRREANDHLKRLLKDHAVAEDEERHAQTDVQKLTDRYIAEIDKVLAAKETDLLAI